jgi:hypothetical protein
MATPENSLTQYWDRQKAEFYRWVEALVDEKVAERAKQQAQALASVSMADPEKSQLPAPALLRKA